MNITFSNQKHVSDVSIDSISAALSYLTFWNDTLTISHDDNNYMLATRTSKNCFSLEYFEGLPKFHYRSEDNSLPLPLVADVLWTYSQHSSGWNYKVKWKAKDFDVRVAAKAFFNPIQLVLGSLIVIGFVVSIAYPGLLENQGITFPMIFFTVFIIGMVSELPKAFNNLVQAGKTLSERAQGLLFFVVLTIILVIGINSIIR